MNPDPAAVIALFIGQSIIDFPRPGIIEAVGGQTGEIQSPLVSRTFRISQGNKPFRFLFQVRCKGPGPGAVSKTQRLIGIEQATDHKPLPKIGGIAPDL